MCAAHSRRRMALLPASKEKRQLRRAHAPEATNGVGQKWECASQEGRDQGHCGHHRNPGARPRQRVRILIRRSRFPEVFMTRANVIRNRSATVSSPRGSETQSAEAHTPDSALRKTGIRFTGDMPWGAHFCMFYETKEDLLDTSRRLFRGRTGLQRILRLGRLRPYNGGRCKELLYVAPFLILTSIWRLGTSRYFRVATGISRDDQFDLKRITGGWSEKLSSALIKGYEGMRVSGNAFWMETKHWKEFCEYEQELDRALADQKMIVMCTYSLHASRSVDHFGCGACTPNLPGQAKRPMGVSGNSRTQAGQAGNQRLNGALDILSKRIPGQ